MAYGPLTEDREYLKKVKIGDDPTDTVSTDEKTKAESYADSRINSKLKTTFSLAPVASAESWPLRKGLLPAK